MAEKEINLLDRLPQTKRNVKKRAEEKKPEDIAIAKQFGEAFFDGERKHGYGGYRYDGRWLPVAKRFVEYYKLPENAKILDVGCAKGFLMYDFKQVLPHCEVSGVDVSAYAKKNAHEGMDQYMQVCSGDELPYDDHEFDLVVSINSIHNLPLDRCKKSLQEIERVSKAHKYITVDAWRTEEEHQALLDWILTAETYMSVDDWKRTFNEIGYKGDYWWFIP
ncbi:MAG: methyltransferase type 11 [Verrucomicrobia bacterium CG_4_10_14_3_um_filter_43_23]|nr:MAG: methyltransferase type 11 [Verrucomicrobia bacterium CG1_02_43_26]PIP58989.1 MAG: methyltransferase type 11 [Verrucomicrobia bacterium CG22_combo_CG10-13_8_21_14_all_43_17]PIX59087.1 MAG: methyltransferase type 11 [Verrucomicrobia bacterium CG_4_10_14_3_um_filter_43_23]PIY61391.1 MAG: methyltransferase type 11 [Verrucomicrobia bacterium CG_4_10_14_0_8_um_filter_43_34]PJA44173.1 MAG: methyltransferase type 11 [Verrucomicrobia bacterium CG_4_9_14_3_um_filter_43_20]